MPRLVDRLISPAVGLATEAYAHHKNKDKSRSASPNPAQSGPLSSPAPPSSSQTQPPHHHSEEDPAYESDTEHWELDDAAYEAAPVSEPAAAITIPKGNWAGPASVEQIVDAFLAAYPPNNDRSAGSRLALPVIIPQKRPQAKSRGFVRAYAPVLDEAGVSQEAWLGFLDCFQESIKVSPAFDAINVAVTGLGFATAAVPSATLQAITTLVQAADIIAKETYTRSRTNTFLTQCNARFFNPQGLYALLMTYQPANADAVHRIDISSTIARTFGTSEAAKGSGANPAKNAPTLPVAEAEGQEEHALSDKVKAQLKLWTGRSSGVSRGEAEMPAAVAPLVYPGLDEASAEQKASWYSRGLEFTRDYFDRREAAKWLEEHPDSKLAGTMQTPAFASPRADPTQTQRNISARTAITGREGRLAARRRQRLDAFSDKKDAKWQNMAQQGGLRGLVGKATGGKQPMEAARRVLKMDVIYLLVVRRPTEEEVRAAVVERGKEGQKIV